jgi:hypothetical protein
VLAPETIRDIVAVRVASVLKRMVAKDITLSLTPAVYEYLAEKGYDPQFGARPLNRLIQNTILNRVANMLLGAEEKSKYFDIVDDYETNLAKEYAFIDAYKTILSTIMNYGVNGKLVIDQKVNNLSTLEIANKYKMNHSTVRVKIHKVMQDVRLELKKTGINYEEFGF